MSDEVKLNLSDEELLELEMANARGGNDWLQCLTEHGNSLLHDVLALHRELKHLKALNEDKFRTVEAYRRAASDDKARIKALAEAGRELLTVCLPPHDVSGSAMFQRAASKFRIDF